MECFLETEFELKKPCASKIFNIEVRKTGSLFLQNGPRAPLTLRRVVFKVTECSISGLQVLCKGVG